MEVRDQRSDVGGQKSEVGSQKSEVRSRRSEVGSQKSEVGRLRKEEIPVSPLKGRDLRYAPTSIQYPITRNQSGDSMIKNILCYLFFGFVLIVYGAQV